MEDPFIPVTTPSSLLPIAEARLPYSCNVYNMILMAMKIETYNAAAKFYILNGDYHQDSAWIVVNFEREDYGLEINISAPSPPYKINEPEMFKTFAATKIIDWSKTYMMCALDGRLSGFMINLQLKLIGNPIIVKPCNLYMMDREIGKRLKISIPDPAVRIESLNSEVGIEFVNRTWLHSKEGSLDYIRRVLTNLPSSGVFVKDKLVASSILSTSGFFGFLYTLKSHRGLGYGKLVEQSIITKLAMESYVPFCTVELRNVNSLRFHDTKIEGLKLSHTIDFIFHKPESFDD